MIEKLKGKVPEFVFTQLNNQSVFQNLTALRLAHFLAQCDHESAGFRVLEENLNYSASRLRQVFPKYFDTMSSERYAHLPMKIGNRVYANRMGNGNEDSGDGYRFRGRGYIQLTGKELYQKLSLCMNIDFVDKPELVSCAYPLASAVWFFKSKKIWDVCDRGAKPMDVEAVTRRVNGGVNGLEHRQELFNHYWKLLS
jgi:hypothetical protein